MKRNKFSVWVLELGILHPTRGGISHWEVWSAHNTKAEAETERRKPQKIGKKTVSMKFQLATSRVRKYVPEPNDQ